jgi:replicative DNA helicase
MNRQQEIECRVLGAVIWRDYLVAKVGFLNQEDFYFIEHRVIWDKIKELAKNGKPINLPTLYGEILKENTKDWQFPPGEYLASLIDHVVGFSYLENAIVDYAKEIKCEAIKNSDEERTPEDIVRMADDLRSMEATTGQLSELKLLLNSEMDKFQSGEYLKETGYKTGFNYLDETIGGMRAGDMIVLSGRPSSGKTTLSLNIACHVARECLAPVLFINLEMTNQMVIRKIIAKYARIATTSMLREMSEHDIKKIMHLGESIVEGRFPLTIYDKGSANVVELADLLKSGKYKFMVIDQLTKIKPSVKRDRFDLEIADKTFAIKEMAKQYKIPVLLLHQANRELEKRADKRPMLSDLRDSGAIEQDADIVLFIHREAIYSGDANDKEALVRVAKNKMGPIGDIRMQFNPEYSEFVEKVI